MDPVVLDTDVFSFFAKADTRGALYVPLMTNKRLCLCFQTVAELRLWAVIRGWGSSRRQALESRIDQFVILPYDSIMAQQWAEITAHRRKIGLPIDCGDAWIAASAVRHNAILLTHNGKHYADIPGLKLVSHGS